MPKINELPAASSAQADAVVAADNAARTLTERVTLDQIATLSAGYAPVQSVAGRTGAITLTVSDVANAVATGDSRLTDSRAPTAHSNSHKTGGIDAISPADIGAAATGHTHTLSNISDAGTAASRNAPASGDATSAQVVLGSDTRLTDSRVPTSHASTHRSTGADYPAPVCVAPSSLSASQNNWNPGRADVLYVTSSTAVTITGLSSATVPDGFCVLVLNNNASGGAAVTLAHESASSDAENRFRSGFSANVLLAANGGSAVLVYHAAVSRWRIL